MEEVRCNYCKKQNTSEIYKNDKLCAVMCQDCSLVYLNPRLTAEEYKDYYNRLYQKDRHNILDYKQAVERLERRDSYGRKIKHLDYLQKFINKNDRVLEIGSGWGTLLKVLKDKIGCQVTGVEISELAARVGNEHYGLNIINKTFENFIESELQQKYNFIILHHVLEHFLDPAKVLEQIKSELLEDDGYLYLAVPNVASPDEALDRFFRVVHCYYFSPLTIYKMLQSRGFKIIDIIIDSQDIKLVAKKETAEGSRIATDDYDKKYSIEKITNLLKAVDKKYSTLRSLRKVASSVLPDKMFNSLRDWSVRFLKKIGLIKF